MARLNMARLNMGRLSLGLRRFKLGLATLFGRRRGWFIPYRYADTLAHAGALPVYAEIEALFQAAGPAMAHRLEGAATYWPRFRAFDKAAPPEPRWQQDWFPRLDGVMAYAMVLEFRPRRIVEIGSGHSTRFMLRAIKDGGLDCAFTSIDPAPRADISRLPLRLVGATLDEALARKASDIDLLTPGDILFVDSSHILMPGTDVDVILNRLLPRLPGGVIIHIHDIFLPDDYPPDWAWRGYGEQQGVAPLMTLGGFEILFASHFMVTRQAALLSRLGFDALPLAPGAVETSLWLRKPDRLPQG